MVPPLAYYAAYRVCLGLQQHDRQVLVHGVETGIIRRRPMVASSRCTNPSAPPESAYAGWAVPKKVNRLGALAPTVQGFFRPIESPAPTTDYEPIG